MTKLMERLAPNGDGGKSSEPTVSYETIDRERALEFLKFNRDNRRVQKPEVRKISRDLTSGRHKPRVAQVRITRDGRLIDGQHFLIAVVETGVSGVATVHRNAEDDEWIVIDQASRRTLGQTLTRMGFPNAQALGTVARYTMVWRETGYPKVAGKAQTYDRTITQSEIVEFAANHAEELMPQVREAQARCKRYPLLPRTWVAAIAVAFADADPELGPAFMAQLFDEAEADAMPLLLRQRLSSYAMKSRDHRPGINVLIAMSIKAFNAWATGREMKQLRYSPIEDFPRIVNPKEVIG